MFFLVLSHGFTHHAVHNRSVYRQIVYTTVHKGSVYRQVQYPTVQNRSVCGILLYHTANKTSVNRPILYTRVHKGSVHRQLLYAQEMCVQTNTVSYSTEQKCMWKKLITLIFNPYFYQLIFKISTFDF